MKNNKGTRENGYKEYKVKTPAMGNLKTRDRCESVF